MPDEKQLIKEGRHVGLDFYDLLIEGVYAENPCNTVRGGFDMTSPTPAPPLLGNTIGSTADGFVVAEWQDAGGPRV